MEIAPGMTAEEWDALNLTSEEVNKRNHQAWGFFRGAVSGLSWIDPVTDRTQSDIDNRTPKAFLNFTDLNRIEDNLSLIVEMIAIEGRNYTVGEWDALGRSVRDIDARRMPKDIYYHSSTFRFNFKNNWNRRDFPKDDDSERIRGNIDAVKRLFPEVILSIPPGILRWQYLNTLERIILEMYEALKWDIPRASTEEGG